MFLCALTWIVYKEVFPGGQSCQYGNDIPETSDIVPHYQCWSPEMLSLYSETCIRRNRMGPKIFSTLDKFPHYTK
jgi:hypothetical protein